MLTPELITKATEFAGPTWPLDRSVAVNPFHALLGRQALEVLSEAAYRLGHATWPSGTHLDEARRRGLAVTEVTVPPAPLRLRTVAERSINCLNERAARLVGATLLEASTGHTGDAEARVVHTLRRRSGWSGESRRIRRRVAALFVQSDEELSAFMSDWSDDLVVEELRRHSARVPGWMAWATWCDEWRREPHVAAMSRRMILRLSLAVDRAFLEAFGVDGDDGPEPFAVNSNGSRVLQSLEAAVHAEMIERLSGSSRPSRNVALQVVACIDVRSEVIRRALEDDPEIETFGFAGFFGLPAQVAAAGADELRDALPVLVTPTVTIEGGQAPSVRRREQLAATDVIAELTHEPEAMFAVAESAGWLSAPWLLSSVIVPRLRPAPRGDGSHWRLVDGDRVTIAEGALRGMGLTKHFAPSVLLLSHRADTVANTHAAALQCGACAGHAGSPNAAALADLLNDNAVREALRTRGIDIPRTTTFWSGEHNTTTDVIELHETMDRDVLQRCEAATARAAKESRRRWRESVGARRRSATVRTRDVSDLRPEWGLANHVAFVVAPRSSLRGADLDGRAFLHSYDSSSDESGEILQGILAAPMVVGHWINMTYYTSSVAPNVLGCGDKTLLNPVGDFGVIAGDDPQLRIGLPWQSLAVGSRPYHLPVRLLVAVEAPRQRIEEAVRANETVRRLVENEWVKLIGRDSPSAPWRAWRPGVGLESWQREKEEAPC